jgi:hypothetical protein
MKSGLILTERRLVNDLTTIKLAIQMLERRTGLSPEQRHLVQVALRAGDHLTHELFDR